MKELLPELLSEAAEQHPDRMAIKYGPSSASYEILQARVADFGTGLVKLGLARGDRVAIFLEKRLETVIAAFGAAAAGGVFVPVNPLLRTKQVEHILRDCNVRFFVTSADRLNGLQLDFGTLPDLRCVVLVDAGEMDVSGEHACERLAWEAVAAEGTFSGARTHRVIDTDMAAIFYTSGSTGLPKGVVLSHRNLVIGAKSVSHYLGNTKEDRILSVLPLSFDAGFSQITTAFNVGASVVLMNYLLPKDVLRSVEKEFITGLAGVPPLWMQLAQLDLARAAQSLRYVTNTGGRMPRALLDRLRAGLPRTQVFLMYGLTEAFRSTYLDPAELDRRPDSIGKAIPDAEILVVREDGSLCSSNEPGELVHRGPLVSLGYWNDPVKTAERFKPAPNHPAGLCLPETAVWSGDTVRMDEEGFLYFVGRRDEMIKTSGYRVSPTEVEEAIYSTGLVREAAVVGVPDAALGEAIVAVVAYGSRPCTPNDVIAALRKELPSYMVPQRIVERSMLPRSHNGKIDRKLLSEEILRLFEERAA